METLSTLGVESRMEPGINRLLKYWTTYFARWTNGFAKAEPMYENAVVEETEDSPKPIPVDQFSECLSDEKR